jgi:integrase
VRITVRETLANGKPGWVVDYRNGPTRQRRFAPTKKAADRIATELRGEVAEAGRVWSSLSAVDRAEVIGVWHEAQGAGVRLRQVWEDWKAGRTGGGGGGKRTLKQAVNEVVAAKSAAGRRIRYVRELETFLWRFVKGKEAADCAEVSPADIEAWLARRPLAASTKAAELGRLSALFSFCVRRKYRPDNPVEAVDKPTVEVKPARILTVEEATAILGHVPSAGRAWFILALFAGIRPEELDRIGWDAVDLGAGVVRIDAEVSKVRQRRLVHLRLGVAEALKQTKERGAALPLTSITRRRMLRKVRDAMGWAAWPQDVLRHTATSYWLAVEPDAARLALELGNSPAMIFRHYRELVRREEAERFWGLVNGL